MKYLWTAVLIFIFTVSGFTRAQDSGAAGDSVEITILDSYVTPELPHSFLLSFFTSAPCRSQVKIANKYNYKISDKLTEEHNIKIDLTGLSFSSKSVPFTVTVEDSLGRQYKSDVNEFELPSEVKIKSESNFLLFCLFGGAVFALPSPAYVTGKSGNYFSLTKEIPVISFMSSGFNYPAGYLSVEYSYIFKARYKNLVRVGYKQIIPIPALEYISPGVDGFTNFKGFNGISGEVSVGWVRILNTFTLYTKYRYSFKPGDTADSFSEISLGLYSNFFSVHL